MHSCPVSTLNSPHPFFYRGVHPIKYFGHLENTSGLFEVRIEVGTDIYRVFSFFDQGKLIILVNGLQKKTQKTPKGEIEQAGKLKKHYFDERKGE